MAAVTQQYNETWPVASRGRLLGWGHPGYDAATEPPKTAFKYREGPVLDKFSRRFFISNQEDGDAKYM